MRRLNQTNKINKFTTSAKISYDVETSASRKRDYWKLEESFNYDIGYLGSGRTVKVPKGFLTDGASVPRVFWSFLPPWGLYGQAAILHDFLCDYGLIFENDKPKFIERAETDAIFFECLGVLGVPKHKILAIKTAVNSYRIITNPFRRNKIEDFGEIAALYYRDDN